ncbi:MAG: RdgB/HAM1 family non-canonical purine NTP pyrophosphatase [Verrucomicrobiota bacterium]|nr:RdgB/HAM1 family non-canonical purine NTP pyrophosphatase [Verrucomicrobiota bacterium]
MRQLLVATRNVHKTEEISFILEGLFQVLDLSAVADAPEVEETGTTFVENARLKAVAISKTTGGLVLADDSGLEVDALGGEPGVYSARYAGPGAEDATNNRKLLAELAGIPEQKRTGRFRCVMVIAREGEVLEEFEGCVEGMILEEGKGTGGFGYDPLFVPEGHAQSFAELGPGIKNSLSHRARAMEKVVAWLRLAD